MTRPPNHHAVTRAKAAPDDDPRALAVLVLDYVLPRDKTLDALLDADVELQRRAEAVLRGAPR